MQTCFLNVLKWITKDDLMLCQHNKHLYSQNLRALFSKENYEYNKKRQMIKSWSVICVLIRFTSNAKQQITKQVNFV